jgi:uncharacterized protein YkwD
MTRIRIAALAVCLALPTVGACTSITGATDNSPVFLSDVSSKTGTVDANEAAALISDYRRTKGLGPVTVDPTLMQIAKVHSDRMAAADTMSHVLPGEGSYEQRLIAGGFEAADAGENVAAGQPTLESVLNAWRASPGHNANLLDPAATKIGIALAINPASKYKYYWTLDLGTWRPKLPPGTVMMGPGIMMAPGTTVINNGGLVTTTNGVTTTISGGGGSN